MQYLAVREERSEPESVRLRFGLAMELEALSETEFDVVQDGGLELDDTGFASWLLSREGEPGRRAQLEFRDYASRNRMYIPKSPDLALVGIQRIDAVDGAPQRLGLKLSTPFDGSRPRHGERFLLQPRFTDFTSDRVINFLLGLDGQGGGFFVDVLRDPVMAAGQMPLLPEVERVASAQETLLGLSPSQLTAYQAMRRSRLRAVWGPPGTGKTHFLAMAILALAEAHAAAGRPFRVLITAFTHAAIENLLKKVAQLGNDRGRAIALGKVKRWQGATPPDAHTVEERALGAWLGTHPICVAGATVYSALKASAISFDLVVIDEASQVRIGEAAVPASLVAPEGRLVLAGDDLQLPPIVQGAYPDARDGLPKLHRSVFEDIRSRGPQVVSQLLENRRMNDVLTSYAAGLLYGPRYCCFDEGVARRRVRLERRANDLDLVSACLSPEQPLTLVLLDGIQATSQSPIEARLVADVVMRLREELLDDGDTVYVDDREFFRHGLFVVSPHRAQNRAIRQALSARRAWTSAPFVDTVDKMQGQEADAVVVSYGVSDPEYALMESEFIYSVNRLNVAITRARSKCVVFLSHPLLASLPKVLDSPEAERGLAYMRDLVESARAEGQINVFPLEDGVTATVIGVSRTFSGR